MSGSVQIVASPAARMVDLHRARTCSELIELMRKELSAICADDSLALLLHEEQADRDRVELAMGPACGLREGSVIDAMSWQPEEGMVLPVCHGQRRIGSLVLDRIPAAESKEILEALLLHYGTAHVNLYLGEEVLDAMAYFGSSLQAFEQGVVLLQEQDPEVLPARFLQLCLAAFNASAGAVFIFEEVDNTDSTLALDHALGLPETMLEDLCLDDEARTWWPGSLVGKKTIFLERDTETGQFPVLCNEMLSDAMQNLIGTPLHYHGVEVGVCVLFNIGADTSSKLFQRKLASGARLCELGAAVFHRRELEARALESKQLSTQLEIASIIQSRLIPSDPPTCDHLQFAWRSVMSQKVGGDYLDCIMGEEGDYLVTIADVSGHGVDSALLMSSFRSTNRTECLWCEPDELLQKMNDVIADEVGDTGMFLTAATLRISADGRSFGFSSAGHNPVMLYRVLSENLLLCESSGPPLGVFSGASYELEDVQTEPGDVLVLYTDGVVEAADQKTGEMFGEERLESLIRESAGGSAWELLESIFDAVHRFSGTEDQEDDVSVLVVKFA